MEAEYQEAATTPPSSSDCIDPSLLEATPPQKSATSNRSKGNRATDRAMLTGMTDGLVDKREKSEVCGRCELARKSDCEFSKLTPIVRADREAEDTRVDREVEYARIEALEHRVSQLEFQLSNIREIRSPSVSSLPDSPESNLRISYSYERSVPVASQLAESIRHNFLPAVDSLTCLYDFIRSSSEVPIVFSKSGDEFAEEEKFDNEDSSLTRMNIGQSSLDWRLAVSELARALTIHLLDSFFVSCCGYLPIFDHYHSKLDYYRNNVGELNASDQVAVAAFCAMGGRSSPHSAILGIAHSNPDTTPSIKSIARAGVRREAAVRSLGTLAMDIYNTFELAFDATIANLEVTLVLAQMLIFSELKPRKSKVVIGTAFNQYKELQDSKVLNQEQKNEMIARLGVPLFVADATITVYSKRPSSITTSDLKYFGGDFKIPNFRSDSLAQILDSVLFVDPGEKEYENETLENYGGKGAKVVTHGSLVTASRILSCWIAHIQREFGRVSVGAETDLADEIRVLWSAIDQIHAAVQRIQQDLVNLSYVPIGCQVNGSTESPDLHLRFVTRLDRDVMDVVYLLHTLITELKMEEASNYHLASLGFEFVSEWGLHHRESERRVRKCLKLTAFYSQLYITSMDRHMTYHLIWQLELFPNWCETILQRFSEMNGPETEELEVTETELDFFLNGLKVAAFYHPVAEARIYEFQENRRAPRISSATPDQSRIPSQNDISE